MDIREITHIRQIASLTNHTTISLQHIVYCLLNNTQLSACSVGPVN